MNTNFSYATFLPLSFHKTFDSFLILFLMNIKCHCKKNNTYFSNKYKGNVNKLLCYSCS